MNYLSVPAKKNIALVAHDSQKGNLLAWARYNREILREHALYATGTTGALLEQQLEVAVTKLKTGNRPGG